MYSRAISTGVYTYIRPREMLSVISLNEKFNLGSREVDSERLIGAINIFRPLLTWSGNHLLTLSDSAERAPACAWHAKGAKLLLDTLEPDGTTFGRSNEPLDLLQAHAAGSTEELSTTSCE